MLYWLTLREVLAIHDLQLTHHGGASGIRDMGLLESAMARAQNIAAYAEVAPALAVLAAAYGSGIVRNHPFVDGNKRTGLMAAFVFIERNGSRVIASQEEAYFVFHDLAAGKLSEGSLAQWLDANTEPAPR
ncbi:death-on-curing protein [Silvibacterium bohemicum]|uniref:Death-on-curing protein n=1 Tax=Silvibacterium bohemicum TaxID=1577686 RepID=A0A841JUC9_9BACT|nr:type II toxin-antitoxin system death-on-curing family toxin [Silvibacterium bohemicum]MBB6144956.1 death-on-curing protein [Silvibacterium bohemicum]